MNSLKYIFVLLFFLSCNNPDPVEPPPDKSLLEKLIGTIKGQASGSQISSGNNSCYNIEISKISDSLAMLESAHFNEVEIIIEEIDDILYGYNDSISNFSYSNNELSITKTGFFTFTFTGFK